jgi:hypothetical protein
VTGQKNGNRQGECRRQPAYLLRAYVPPGDDQRHILI